MLVLSEQNGVGVYFDLHCMCNWMHDEEGQEGRGYPVIDHDLLDSVEH